jgi:hypothetical protein
VRRDACEKVDNYGTLEHLINQRISKLEPITQARMLPRIKDRVVRLGALTRRTALPHRR